MKFLVVAIPPSIYHNVSVRPVVCPHFLGRYLNSCNTIDRRNRIWQSYIALEKYWVTQSGYFRLETTVELGVCITGVKLLYCPDVAEGNVATKNSTLGYNNRTVY